MPTSITDFLTEHGWTINEEKQCFEAAHDSIPFSEISGTVDSFRAKAARKGWVVPTEQPETDRQKSFAEKLKDARTK